MERDWSKFPKDDLEAARIFAVEYYRQIAMVKSPALGNEFVYFNHKGIGHILHKASRSRGTIIERLMCLRHVRHILSDPSAEVEYRKYVEKEYLRKQGEFILEDVEAQYWTFRKQLHANLIIKVVVRQVNRGVKYFYSIFRVIDK
jgi:hypothetical protein